jgi:hypothetical protein
VNHLENSKTVADHTDSVTAAQTHTLVIDTIGFAYASADVGFKPWSNAAFTNQPVATVLKLDESDDNATYSAITPFVGGGEGGFTIPTPANTTDDVLVRFDVDCRGRKRYLRISASPYTTGTIYTVCRLGKGEDGPDSATKKGVNAAVSG